MAGSRSKTHGTSPATRLRNRLFGKKSKPRETRRRILRSELLEDRRLLAANVAKVADTSDTFDWFYESFNIPFPNRATVQLRMAWDSSADRSLQRDELGGNCSGAMIDANHVLTAAHCVYEREDGKGFADWVFVHAARNGDFERPFGEALVTRTVIPSSYASWNSQANYGKWEFDYAVLTVDRNLGAQTGTYGFGSIPDSFLEGQRIKTIHYPGESFLDAPDGGSFDGTEQYVSSGTVSDAYYRTNGFSYLLQDMWITGGSSGGPVFVEDSTVGGTLFVNSIIGVNSTTSRGPIEGRFPFDYDWDGDEVAGVLQHNSNIYEHLQDWSGDYYDHTTVDRPMLANAHKWLDVSADDQRPSGLNSAERQDWDSRIGNYKLGTITNDQSVTIRVPVWNGGTATARNVRVDFYLAPNAGNSTNFDRSTKLGTSYISFLSPFRITDAALTTRIPDSVSAGSYKVYSVIDPFNSVKEKPTPLNDLKSSQRFRHYGRQDITVVRSTPVINAGGPYYVASGDTIGLNGSLSSYTGNASRLQFEWRLDADSTYGETGAAAAQGNEIGRSPKYLALEASNGLQRLLGFQARTPFGGTSNDSAVVTIDNSLAFESFDPGIPGLLDADLAFADFDRDGDQDLALNGIDAGGLVVNDIYINEGGEFLAMNSGLQSTASAFSSWVDYDNDGDLDLYQSGNSGVLSALYRNDSGVFSAVSTGLLPVRASATAWADIDSDGDFDVVISGIDSSGITATRLFENLGGSFIESLAGAFSAVSNGSLAWADFDRDGKQDLLLTGQLDSGNPVTGLYRNTGSAFVGVSTVLPNTSSGQAKWGDFDNDGYPDVAIAGSTLPGPNAAIYRNNGDSTFSFRTSLPGVAQASLDWGDFDNDGDRDLVLNGTRADGSPITELFQNQAGSFYEYQAGMSRIADGDTKFVDVDSDGNLDVIAIGANIDGEGSVGAYLSQFSRTNSAPRVINLDVSYEEDGAVVLSWDGTDSETAAPGLSYNLRLGTTPGGSEIVALSPSRDGNVRGSSYRLESFLGGRTYYWSVEANDASGQTITSQESTFGVYFDPAPSYSVAGVFDGDATWADFNNDGLLDLIVVGEGLAGPQTRVYENNGTGLSEVVTTLPSLSNGAMMLVTSTAMAESTYW